MTLKMGLGALIDCSQNPFMESFYQVVVTVSPQQIQSLHSHLAESHIEFNDLGEVIGTSLQWGDINLKTEQIKEVYESSWTKSFPRLS